MVFANRLTINTPEPHLTVRDNSTLKGYCLVAPWELSNPMPLNVDGWDMEGVTFLKAKIVYDGGPISVHRCMFFGCTFEGTGDLAPVRTNEITHVIEDHHV